MKTLLSLSALCIALLSSGVNASERAETGWELIEKGGLVVDVISTAEFDQVHLY
ncbi:rhodanese-like domain-containing protein, partial [Vibrio coralliirubri]